MTSLLFLNFENYYLWMIALNVTDSKTPINENISPIHISPARVGAQESRPGKNAADSH